jgi:peptidyl-tRNA hydrolase
MIAQGQFFEECIELYPNQVLHYSFNSSQDVNFNIHYHGMEGRQYAIKKNNITSYSGELVCNEMDFYDTDQENFCMIWSNLNEVDARVSLKYHITTRTPPSP